MCQRVTAPGIKWEFFFGCSFSLSTPSLGWLRFCVHMMELFPLKLSKGRPSLVPTVQMRWLLGNSTRMAKSERCCWALKPSPWRWAGPPRGFETLAIHWISLLWNSQVPRNLSHLIFFFLSPGYAVSNKFMRSTQIQDLIMLYIEALMIHMPFFEILTCKNFIENLKRHSEQCLVPRQFSENSSSCSWRWYHLTVLSLTLYSKLGTFHWDLIQFCLNRNYNLYFYGLGRWLSR